MSFLINNGIPESDLPVKSPSGAARVRYVDGDGKSYSSAMPDVIAASALVQDAIDGVVANAESEIGVIVNGMGYLPPVAFTSGLNVNSSRFTVTYNGVTYAPVADAVHFTTTGTFNPAQWRVIQGVTAADLGAPGGAGLVRYGSRSVSAKLDEIRSVADYASFTAALSSVGAGGGRLAVVPGVINVTSNTTIPANVALDVHKGALIHVAAGVRLTVLGQINAGNQEVFDGPGIVDLDNSPNEYNLAWFKAGSGYINQRWDFAKRGMATFRTKVIRIPRPYEGQDGVLKSGNRLFWLFNSPIVIDDAQNASTWYVEGEFTAAGDCPGFLQIGGAAKPENIYFYGPIQASASATQNVTNGINIIAGARIFFFGAVVMNGFKTSVKIGGTDQQAAVGSIEMPRVQCSFFTDAALSMYGKAVYSVQDVKIGTLGATAAQVAGKNALEMRGLLRSIEVGEVYYATDVPKDGYSAHDAENVVLIESNSEGTIQHVEIGAIYQSTANNCLRCASAVSDNNRIIDVTVKRIFGKFAGSAAVLNHCQRVNLVGVENRSNVTVGSTATNTTITAGVGLNTLVDDGTQTIVNGLGKQTRGGGVPPAPAAGWPIGVKIRETSDGRVYLRVANDNLPSDFLLVRGAAFRGATGSRPALGTQDAGRLYLDTTLAAAGKPIWWTGTAWVDGLGAVV